jgi:diguanylate cyclase (GGDEF)-like protein
MATSNARRTTADELLREAARPDVSDIKASNGSLSTERRRRRSDHERRTAARAALTSTAAERQAAGSLIKEVVAPLGLGIAVEIATLAMVALAANRAHASIATWVGVGAVTMTIGLLYWTAVILKGATKPAIENLTHGLQQVEVGNYDVRLERVGAREFSELAEGFNRMATIVSHQRDRLKQLAETDPLTELSNHRHFHERLRSELQHAKDTNGSLAVVMLDLDRFKAVNEESGHARGDETLRLAGDALRKVVRADDCVARLGGDDFAMIVRGADSGYSRDVAERSRAAISRATPDGIEITVSAGYVCWPDHTREENLVELAGMALALAKKQGGDQAERYDVKQAAALPSMREQRDEITDLLRQPNPIVPVFQPLVELATGRIVGYEALSRFNDPSGRSTEAWFNQAAACGLAAELEGAAIEAALACGFRPEGTYLSLNASPSAISSGRVRRILPDDLRDYVIEITEHELAAEDGALEQALQELRARGARIAVDDAGAGYAGLQQVMRIQPDIVKLDRSLIERVDQDSAKAALIEFFVLFAGRVGAVVCTEGIETMEELSTLVDLGVAVGQGYVLARPAKPWPDLHPELKKKLALGALRSHKDVTENPVGAVGPQNRRLNRYHVVGSGKAARRTR